MNIMFQVWIELFKIIITCYKQLLPAQMTSFTPVCSSSTLDCATTSNQCSKEFLLKNFKVNYDNKYSVRHVTDQTHTGNLVITNYICRKVGEQVFKRTEILIGHQLIVLEDSYQFEELANSTTPKVLLVKPDIEIETSASQEEQKLKDIDEPELDDSHDKRDRKNVVKNIVKAFETWLREELSREEYRDKFSLQNSRKTLERMVIKVKFNNRLINSLINNPNLNVMFEKFLKEEASLWLDHSKIKDRTSHKEAIEAFLKACSSNTQVSGKPRAEIEVL